MQGQPTPARRWLTLLCWGYVALIAGWLALRGLVFDRLWWMALVNRYTLALFLPLLVLSPLALWRRQVRFLVGLVLPRRVDRMLVR